MMLWSAVTLWVVRMELEQPFQLSECFPIVVCFSHVGDSSILYSDGSGLRQISKCHTLGDELIEKHGPEAANDMPEHYMHTLTRCMGQDIDFEVDLGEQTLSRVTS